MSLTKAAIQSLHRSAGQYRRHRKIAKADACEYSARILEEGTSPEAVEKRIRSQYIREDLENE